MDGRVDISDYLREYHEEGEIVLRAKWAMDGAESLDEAAGMLRLLADELEALAQAGFHLMCPIEDDYGFAHRGDDDERERSPRLREQIQRHHLNEDAPAPPG